MASELATQSAASAKENRRVAFVADLLASLSPSSPADDPPFLTDLRSRSAAVAQELAFPSQRAEAWRFTDLSSLLATDFVPARAASVDRAALEILALPEAPATRLVFVNGRFAPDLSDLSALPEGVWVGNLRSPDFDLARAEPYLGTQPGAPETFAALNAAALDDAAVVWLSRGAIAETPLHLLFLTAPGSEAAIAQPRVLVVAEANSQATLVEEYAGVERHWCQGPDDRAPAWTNGVTELHLADNARVEHVRLQREPERGFHLGRTRVSQARDSRYGCTSVDLGAALSRHDLEILQTGPGTDTRLDGLALTNGDRLADTHSSLVLDHPHGTADQLHKCIVRDRARTVFEGRVFVGQQAQQTDAAQLNRNLLLSPKARVNTKPQLEIIADDVKCTHGATVSQLEEDEIFYLQSRGLDRRTACNLLVDGFAGEVLERLPVPSLRQAVARCVACQTDRIEAL